MTWVTPNHQPEDDDPLPQSQAEPAAPLPEPEPTAPPPSTPEAPPYEPTGTYPAAQQEAFVPPRQPSTDDVPVWRRVVGLGVLLIAAGLTFLALLVVFLPGQAPVVPPDQQVQQNPTAPPTTAPDRVQQDDSNPPPAVDTSGLAGLPTLSPEQAAALLATPPIQTVGNGSAIERQEGDPFTIIPERPRNEVISYEVQAGDSITTIAAQFGLDMNSVGWCNDQPTIFALRPGAELLIPPVDGVCHRVLVQETIAEVAERFNVDDPYTIINSDFNNLFGAAPDSTLQSGDFVFIPGGTSSYIDWQYNPTVERTGGGGGNSEGGFISFAPGEPGSCGQQANPGHAGYAAMPLSSYGWSRGFSSFHTGVDLAADQGTPVFAASAGRVIYAGWNNWGYGNLVVVAHGPFTTFYAHLYSYNVGCGQLVSAGSVIGAVGTTGQSSGPHLHFEIRYNDIATDPLAYYAF